MIKKTLIGLTTAMFILTSCGGASPSTSTTSSTESSSGTSSSTVNPQASVMEMMAPLAENNYTFHLSQNDVEVYQIQFDVTKIYAMMTNPEMSEASEFFLDITNEEQPMLYAPAENVEGAWVRSLADPFTLFYILTPLYLIDVTAMEDIWFTYDAVSSTFELDLQYLDQAFADSDTEGIESFSVRGNGTEVTITIEGMNPENDEDLSLVFQYIDIGTTSVTLPTNLIDPLAEFLETVVQDSTNHVFDVYLYEGNAENLEDGDQIRFQNHARDGEFFITNSYRSIGNDSIYEVFYYGPIENGYESVIGLDEVPVTQTSITEEAYQLALQDFYPVRFTDIQLDWLSETDEFSFGGTPYLRLDAAHFDLVNLSLFPENAVIEDVLISAVSYFGETMLTLSVDVSLGNGNWMRLDLDIKSFESAEVERPFLPEDALNLAEMLTLLTTSQSYHVSQFSINRNVFEDLPLSVLRLTREGDAYSPSGLSAPNYTYQNGVYEKYTWDDLFELPLREEIAQSEYNEAVVQPQWMLWDSFTPDMVFIDAESPNEGTLSEAAYETLLNLDINAVEIVNLYQDFFNPVVTNVDQIAIQEVRLASESGEGYNDLFVEIDVDFSGDEFGTLALTLYATYTQIGSSTVYIPTEYRTN